MSRIKSRQNLEVCGDCGASDATWASVNKGILLCTQCCSVHRSLGRHISQVKSLQRSKWHPNQLSMVCTLNNNGANNIWEHTLLENPKISKKKPLPKDPIQIKTEFIKAKHLQCSFAYRENYEDGLLSVENELGKQLHASVRTPNLETSFRLLIQGADPNYFHDEKGTTPLHVAAKSDQKLQVELLLVYGADPTYPDSHGRTPIDYAKQNFNKDLYHRLVESQYEVTDTFINYLIHRKPDHQNGVHFLLPQGGFESNQASLLKLQKMPNHLFEELAIDVFDEIDRRDTEATWYSCGDAIDLNVVPFLPVDPTLSTTRNQGRQKLARFTTPELKSLVYDILIDTQRRQLLSNDKGRNINSLNNSCNNLRNLSQISDDDPLYDSVASDEDYAVLPPIQENTADKQPTNEGVSDNSNVEKSENTDNNTANNSNINHNNNSNKDKDVVEQLTKKLVESDTTITDLKAEVNKLKARVESLQTENYELKTRLSQAQLSISDSDDNNINMNGYKENSQNLTNQELSLPVINNGVDIDTRQNSRKIQRPTSMYETREGIKIPNWHLMKNQLKQNEQSRNTTQSLYSTPIDRQTVLDCTESITRNLQNLYKTTQDPDKKDSISSSGEKVKFAVANLATILPKDSEGNIVRLMWDILPCLLNECKSLEVAYNISDKSSIDNHLNKIRNYAFHLAKYTKEIVTKYSSNQ